MPSPEQRERDEAYLQGGLKDIESLKVSSSSGLRQRFEHAQAALMRLGLANCRGWTIPRLEEAEQFMGRSFFSQDLSFGSNIGPIALKYIEHLRQVVIRFQLISLDESRGLLVRAAPQTTHPELTDQGCLLQFGALFPQFSSQVQTDTATGYLFEMSESVQRWCGMVRARFMEKGQDGVWPELHARCDELFADLPGDSGQPLSLDALWVRQRLLTGKAVRVFDDQGQLHQGLCRAELDSAGEVTAILVDAGTEAETATIRLPAATILQLKPVTELL